MYKLMAYKGHKNYGVKRAQVSSCCPSQKAVNTLITF